MRFDAKILKKCANVPNQILRYLYIMISFCIWRVFFHNFWGIFSGLDILPHISKSRPNLVENHLSLILHCLLKCDLPNVLVRVIVDTEEISLSVSSTVLLGELLHLANLLLPREVSVFKNIKRVWQAIEFSHSFIKN